MLNPIEIKFKLDKTIKRALTTELMIKSHDINVIEFHISFDGLELTADHTVKVLSVFNDTKSQTNVTCDIVDGKAIYQPDTSIISQYEHVLNYVYVYHGDQSLDVRLFTYAVDSSEIDKTAIKVKTVYDQSYAELITEFEARLQDYKDSLPQASDLIAEVDVILNKFKVDSQSAIDYLGEVSTAVEIAEAERKEAELLREENYNQKVDTAIVEADVVAKVDNKVTELTPRMNELTAQLAQTVNKEATQIVNKLSSKQVSTIRERQPLVLFTDDDGNKAIMTKLKPISEETGVPFTIALLVDRTERNTGISVEQAKQLQDELGWEVASHGLADVALGNPLLTDEEIEEQVRDSMIWFREHGLEVKNYVYPGGQATKKAQRIVSKYANGVLGTGVAPNVYPLQQYNINRLPFPASAPNDNLSYYKSKVDEAVANNQILVWMLHCGMVELDTTQQQHLRDLIAYIKSLGVKTPTLQEALDLVGNVIDINDRQYFMSADGQNNIINTIIKTGNLDGSDVVKITDNPDAFERNKTIVSLVNNNRNLSPSARGGVLITTSLSNSSFISQTFIDQGGRQFTRHAINSTTWSNWNAITISKSKISTTIPARNVPAGTSFWVVINDATILPTDAHVAQPSGTLELGLTWSCWSHGNSALVLEIYNPTKADISMAERVFNIHRFN